MPYELKKVKGGYVVVKKGTTKRYSKEPMPRSKAQAQMRALYANEKRQKGGHH